MAVLMQGLQLTAGATVLDFGAGTGWFARFLTQLGCRVVLLDVSQTALAKARELYERLPIIGDRPARSSSYSTAAPSRCPTRASIGC